MDVLTMLREKLDGCGLYDLQQGTVVYAELAAYAAGLQMIYDQLEELERELFITTAEDRGLEVYEKMLGAYNTDSSLQGRRNSLISAFSITNSDHSRNGMGLITGIYNVDGEFTMDNGDLVFTCSDSLTQEQAERIGSHMEIFRPLLRGFRFET